MSKKTKREIYDEHGFRGVAVTHLIQFANSFPGPIKDGSLPRRVVLTLSRKGWAVPLSEPASMDEVCDFEVTPSGKAALKRVAEAEEAFKSQPRKKRERVVQPA